VRELFNAVVVRMIGRDQGNISAKMSRNTCFGSFTNRIKSQDHFALTNLKKLFSEICDYHYLHSSIFFARVKVLKARRRIKLRQGKQDLG
jgi:hypothetical protein